MDTLPMIWKRSPFLRLLLPFMAGILVYLYAPATRTELPIALVVCLMAVLLLFYHWKKLRTPHFIPWRGAILQTLLLCAGYLLTQQHRIDLHDSWYGQHLTTSTHALVRIKTEPERKPKTLKISAELVQLLGTGVTQSCRGEVYLYLYRNDSMPALRTGDYLLVKNTFREIRSSGNPGSFNYADYCRRQQVFHTALLKEGEWRKLATHQNSYRSFFAETNRRVRAALNSCLPDSSSRGIAEALLIGYRENIDPEVWQAYSQTGIVHIIAISGMHMAMVYQSLRWLLLQIPLFRRKPGAAVLSALLFMWLFAFLTGLPPSVSRAAFMFTLIGLGELSGRKIPVYNNLAASAFLLLCINPYWIADVGFQLSYLAVLSLAIFYTPIYRKFYIPYRLPDAVWKLIAGTLAAQILTFPLCLYYFHQFPILFVLTNLVAVPASTLILYLELLLLALRWCDALAHFLGQLISGLIQGMNASILHISHWRFAVWNELQLSPLQTMLWYVLLLALSVWLWHRQVRAFLMALGITACLLGTLIHRQFSIAQQQHIVLYQLKGAQAMHFIQGRQYFQTGTYSDTQRQEQYVLEPARLFFQLQQPDSSIVLRWQAPGMEAYSFAGRRILRLSTDHIRSTGRVEVDYLILGKGYRPGRIRLSEHFRTRGIILDSSLPFWLIDSIQKEIAMDFHGPVHVVGEQGAWIWSK